MTDEQFSAIQNELVAQGKQLAGLVVGMESLVGNGQPGRIDKLEDQMEQVQAGQNRMYGANGALAFLVAGWEVIKHYAKIV